VSLGVTPGITQGLVFNIRNVENLGLPGITPSDTLNSYYGQASAHGSLPILRLLTGPKMGFSTQCADKREIWQREADHRFAPLCQISRLLGQKYGNTGPKN